MGHRTARPSIALAGALAAGVVVAACSVGTGGARVSTAAEAPGADERLVTILAENEAATARAVYAWTEWQRGTFDVPREVDGRIAGGDPRLAINRYGPESSFLVEAGGDRAEMLPPDELDELQARAFRRWLQDPAVVEVVDPLVRNQLSTAGPGLAEPVPVAPAPDGGG